MPRSRRVGKYFHASRGEREDQLPRKEHVAVILVAEMPHQGVAAAKLFDDIAPVAIDPLEGNPFPEAICDPVAVKAGVLLFNGYHVGFFWSASNEVSSSLVRNRTSGQRRRMRSSSSPSNRRLRSRFVGWMNPT